MNPMASTWVEERITNLMPCIWKKRESWESCFLPEWRRKSWIFMPLTRGESWILCHLPEWRRESWISCHVSEWGRKGHEFLCHVSEWRRESLISCHLSEDRESWDSCHLPKWRKESWNLIPSTWKERESKISCNLPEQWDRESHETHAIYTWVEERATAHVPRHFMVVSFLHLQVNLLTFDKVK